MLLCTSPGAHPSVLSGRALSTALGAGMNGVGLSRTTISFPKSHSHPQKYGTFTQEEYLVHKVEDSIDQHVEGRSSGHQEGPPPPAVILPG